MYRDTLTIPHPTAPQSTSRVDVARAASETFSGLLARAERCAATQAGVIPHSLVAEILVRAEALVRFLDEHAGDRSGLSAEERRAVAAPIRDVLMPQFERSYLGRRIIAKPRGYAGDYLTLAIMYDDIADGVGPIGALLDRVLRSQPACRAVIHRRGLLAEEIARARTRSTSDVTLVTSLACGPAAELFDVFATLDDPRALAATCIDIDDEALEHVAARAKERGVRDRFVLHSGNLVHLATGRRTLNIPPQDLVYSIGLIDYFEDRFVVRLLDHAHSLLRPGGRAVFGNFHVDNPSKALMDHVLDWKLIHRTEEDMHRLYGASRFGRGCTRIRFEASGVNMFAECVKGEAQEAIEEQQPGCAVLP